MIEIVTRDTSDFESVVLSTLYLAEGVIPNYLDGGIVIITMYYSYLLLFQHFYPVLSLEGSASVTEYTRVSPVLILLNVFINFIYLDAQRGHL